MTFRSRIGPEIWIPAFLILGGEAYIFYLNRIWVGLMILLIIAVLIYFTAFRIRYRISGDKLEVKSLFYYLETDISDIHRIRKTFNPTTAPAASLFGRIEIFYDNGNSVIISPARKKLFIDSLTSINRSILTFEAY